MAKIKGSISLTFEQIEELRILYRASTSNVDFCNSNGITKTKLYAIIKEYGFTKDKEAKQYYDAKKLINKSEILNSFKPAEAQKAQDVLSKKANDDGRDAAQIMLAIELKDCKARELGVDIRNALLNDVVKILAEGKSSDCTLETFEYNQQGRIESKNTTATMGKHKALKEVGIMQLLQGLGVLLPSTTNNFHQNNDNRSINGVGATDIVPQEKPISITFIPVHASTNIPSE